MIGLRGNPLYLLIFITMECTNKIEARERQRSVQDESIEDFQRLCPYTDLCFTTARDNFTFNMNVPGYPCCLRCSCEENCGNNCCPDKTERFMSESEVKKFYTPIEQCVFAQVRQFNLSAVNGDMYKMIRKCPDHYSDQNVILKCSREYHEFDFENGDFKTLMPVSSSIFNLTFKSIFCAICHGFSNTNLHFWDTKVKCQNGHKLAISNISQILVKLSEKHSCQVIFQPSSSNPREAVKRCRDTIGSCNITGAWETYDYAVESACLSYTSVYSKFKNIHCFLCNGHKIKDVNDLCQLDQIENFGNSFVALLDFNDLERPTGRKGNMIKCTFGSRYDPYKKTCRPLSCPTGMRLSKKKCYPVYKEIEFTILDVVFGLRLKLYPTQMAKESELNNLLSVGLSLHDDLMSRTRLMLTTWKSEICAFNTYVKLNISLEDMITSMHRENLNNFLPFVSYIAVIVEFNFNGVKNTSATLEELSMMLTSSNYHAQYKIRYSVDDIEMPPNSSFYTIKEEFVTKLNQLELDSFQHEMIINGQTNHDKKYGILTFTSKPLSPKPKCEPDLLVQPKPFCPRIELSNDEFKIDLENNNVSFLENEESPEEIAPSAIFSNLLSSNQDVSVYVCSDEYFYQLLPEYSKVGNVNDELVILTLVCLAFSTISFMITFIVYCILPRLRTVPGLNNMALVFHLFFTHTLALAIAATEIEPSWLCSIVGIFLHFNLLSSFFWMFISTFHMMKSFVNIKEKSVSGHALNKFGHYVILTESLSVGLVISYVVIIVTLGQDSDGYGYGGSNCYIKAANMILYFVALPLGVVITANLGMFTYVIWSVSRIPDMAHNSNHERHYLLIFAKLSTLTGITWVFGFLYQFTNVLLFAYLYIVFNASQGVFIMISFVNKRTLNMLRSHIYTNTDDNTKSSTQSTKITTSTKNEIYISNNAKY